MTQLPVRSIFSHMAERRAFFMNHLKSKGYEGLTIESVDVNAETCKILLFEDADEKSDCYLLNLKIPMSFWINTPFQYEVRNFEDEVIATCDFLDSEIEEKMEMVEIAIQNREAYYLQKLLNLNTFVA